MNNNKKNGKGAWLATLFIDGIKHDQMSIELRRHIIDLPPNFVIQATLIARLLLVILALYFLKTVPFKKSLCNQHQIWELSYILLATCLILPHQRPYNFVFLLPASAYIVWKIKLLDWNTLKLKPWFWIAMLALLLLNLELILGHFRSYYWYFKLVTYVNFMMLGLLMFLKPEVNVNPIKTIT